MKYEVLTSARKDVVWINAGDGSSVGRFSLRGIDIHNSVTEQMAGASECRLCTHGHTTLADWQLFKAKCLEWFGIKLDDSHFNVLLLKPLPKESPLPIDCPTD
jgi:hypothetical protein